MRSKCGTDNCVVANELRIDLGIAVKHAVAAYVNRPSQDEPGGGTKR